MKYIRTSLVDIPLTLTTYDIENVNAIKRNNVKMIPSDSFRGTHIFVQAGLFARGGHKACIYVTLADFKKLGTLL